MKRFAIPLLIIPTLAWARYEDLFGEPPALPESNLPWYVIGLLLVWAGMVWERGWRARAWPMCVGVVGAVCWWVSAEALGVFCLVGGVLGIASAPLWWKEKKK